jgi:RNA polymerase sigma-70 factor (ECF subfamily)
MNSYFSSRAYKERQRTESFPPVHHDAAGSASSEWASDVEQFRKLIGILNPKLRDVLVLCGLEGRSYEEAAALLAIPIGTVRSRLNKARLVLKEAFVAGEARRASGSAEGAAGGEEP